MAEPPSFRRVALITLRVKSQDLVQHGCPPKVWQAPAVYFRWGSKRNLPVKRSWRCRTSSSVLSPGKVCPQGPHQIRIVVEGRLATGDVNRDGRVSILDLILIARELGKRVPANSPVDLNVDGVVSILDLILAAQGIGSTTAAAAPATEVAGIDSATIEAWIAQARLEDDGSHPFKQGIANLQNLLASLIPEKTALLANYPNPFNPETWIPYQLAEPAEVRLTIYDMNGELVRRLAVGHQAAGMYRSRSRAVYWDGRNHLGESVASGLYFYTLTADKFTATRRMLILK